MADDASDGHLQPLEREEAWRTLVRRMLPPASIPATPVHPEMEIFPGEIPPNLPVHIPLPPGSRIVGTVLNGGGLERVTIYVDAVGPPTAVLELFRTRLRAEDWHELQTGRPTARGFNDADESYQMQSHFRREEHGSALFITATRWEDDLTAVRIGVYSDERSLPYRPHEQSGMPPNPFPPLPPPAGARFVMGAGPSNHRGPDGAQTRVVIETELDLTAVTAHYTRHLEAGGWTKQDSGENDRSAWSTWTFQHESGEAWRGLFVAFQRPDIPHRYILEVWVEWLREG